jgi:SAM-dependent methyltransferase
MEKVKFWNQKIINWEQSKYAPHKFFDFNINVKSRRKWAVDFLLQHGRGKKVLEIGCGSGGILNDLTGAGFASYHGIDFSAVAISAAKERKITLPFPVNFSVGSMQDIANEEYDLFFSLGLIDWLDQSEIDALFRANRNTIWLHSYSSSDFSILRKIHETYVYLKYGRKNQAYVPKYWTDKQMRNRAPESKIHSGPNLGICRFIYYDIPK